MFVEKSSEEIAKMTEEAKASYIVEKNAHDLSELGKKHDDAMEAKASKEDLEKLISCWKRMVEKDRKYLLGLAERLNGQNP